MDDLVKMARGESAAHFDGNVKDRRTIGALLASLADAIESLQARVRELEARCDHAWSMVSASDSATIRSAGEALHAMLELKSARNKALDDAERRAQEAAIRFGIGVTKDGHCIQRDEFFLQPPVKQKE